MSTNDKSPADLKRYGKGYGCLVLFLGVPLLALLALAYVWITHNRSPNLVIPPPAPSPPNNAYDDFIKAGRLARAMKHISPLSMPGQQAQTFTFANFAACAKDIVPAHAVLRQALDKPYLNPSGRSVGSGLNFPQFATMRELARELAGEAIYYEMDGQYGRAVDTRLDGMEMGVMMPRGGSLIAGLVGTACESIAESGLESLLPKLSPAELAHVAARLDRIGAKRVSFADLMLEEGYESTAMMQETMRDLSKQGVRGYRDVRDLVGDQNQSPWSKNWKAARYYLIWSIMAALRSAISATVQATSSPDISLLTILFTNRGNRKRRREGTYDVSARSGAVGNCDGWPLASACSQRLIRGSSSLLIRW